eukprot:6548899-Prorocentrum_lima.AAC.1
MPTTDPSRMSVAQELQRPASRLPAARAQLANWLDDYIHKLDHGMKLGALQEPRTILIAVRDTMET